MSDYMRPDEAREIFRDLMANEQAARQRDKDEGRDYGHDEQVSDLYQRIAELKTEIAMLMEERDSAETALKASNELLIGVRLLFITMNVRVNQTATDNINARIDANNKLLKLTED